MVSLHYTTSALISSTSNMETTAPLDSLFNLLAVVVVLAMYLGYLVLNIIATQRVIGHKVALLFQLGFC